MSLIRLSLLFAALTLLAAPSAEAVECSPLSAREWASRCATDRASVEDLVDHVRRFPGLEGLHSYSDVRELLLTGSLGGDCRKALRQLLAAALNLASGRLSGDCCVEHADGRTRSLREALHRHADNCSHERDCGDALRFLRRINDASRVHPCEDDDGSSVDDDGCCKPRSRGWWHRQCLGAQDGRGPGAHPHLAEEDRDEAIRRARRRLERVDLRPCAALDSKNLGGSQGKAEAEVAALALNWGAGYFEGCSRAERMLDRALRALDQENWREAWEIAHDGNHAKGLRRCDDDSQDEDDDDQGSDDDSSDGGNSKAKSKSQGKGKAKGKKK